MRVLVTGGTGFVGLHTTLDLLQQGHEVRLLVRDAEKMQRAYGRRGVEIHDFVQGDMTDELSVNRALQGCDAVVHAAAMVDLQSKNADRVRKTNVHGTQLIVGGAADRGLPALHVSSTAVLCSPELDPIDEDTPLGTTFKGYRQSKVESELFVRGLQEQGAPVFITYPANVMGPGDPGLTESHRGLLQMVNGAVFTTSTGLQMVDVRDLSEVHVRLLQSGTAPERYVVGGNYIEWGPFADLLEDITGQHIRRIPVPGFLLRAAGLVGDTLMRVLPLSLPMTKETFDYISRCAQVDSSKLQSSLGFEFRTMRETLTDTLAWFDTVT